MKLEYISGLMPPTYDLYPDESISMVIKAKDFLDAITNDMEEIEYALVAYTSPHCFTDEFDADEFEIIKDWCVKYPRSQVVFNVEMATPDDSTIYLAVYILKNGRPTKIRWYKDNYTIEYKLVTD